jgi:thymidylate kinase
MIIEITGCSGSGKTTFARMLLERFELSGYRVRHNVSFSESPIRQLLENVYWDIIASKALSFSKDLYSPFIDMAAHTLLSLNTSYFSRMNMMRSIKRKVGVYEKFHRNSINDDVVSVLDEGTIHSAHVLFAHPLGTNAYNEYQSFCVCVPVPDMLVYIRSNIKLAIQRTMVRRDPPWKFRTVDEVKSFMNNAHEMFEALLSESNLNERTQLVIVDDASSIVESLEKIVAHVIKDKA